MRELPPKARSLLIGELERSLLRSEEVSGTDLALHEFLLQELRRVLRNQREGGPRVGNSARLFFKPLEPFLVDDRGDHNHPGRIARCSLELLWTWIRRDLLPDDAQILATAVSDALLANDAPKANHLTRAFQDRVVIVIETSLESAASDPTIHRRMLAKIGTQRPSEDATALKYVLNGRDVLATLAAHLPLRIGNLSNGLLDECKLLIEKASVQDGNLFLYALLTVMSRLAAPWQLIRLGNKAAGSDTAARVAETHYGVAVAALLKTIHETASGLRTELDLPVDSTWGRALGTLRAQIADLLRAEIESMPGRVRRLLRRRPSTEICPNSVLDTDEVAETEALVEFVGACRLFAGELAINEITQRTFAELRQYLDNGMRALLDGARHAGLADRKFRQSQVDAGVRLCAKVFGQDYASLLGKAAEVAGLPERRAMRA